METSYSHQARNDGVTNNRVSGDGKKVIGSVYSKDIKAKIEIIWDEEKKEIQMTQGFLRQVNKQGRRILELEKLVYFLF